MLSDINREPFLEMIKTIRRYRWIIIGRRKIKRAINAAAASEGKLKVVLGSGGSSYSKWISTDLPHFDITKEKNWKYFFSNIKIDNLLAEHVLEHLIETDVEKTLMLACRYLKPGGCFRIAVPDAFHPNEKYIEMNKSSEGNIWGHYSSWNVNSLKKLLINCGFKVNLLEYCNEKKEIIVSDFSDENGVVVRSKSKGFKKEIDSYSSLIIDAIKGT